MTLVGRIALRAVSCLAFLLPAGSSYAAAGPAKSRPPIFQRVDAARAARGLSTIEGAPRGLPLAVDEEGLRSLRASTAADVMLPLAAGRVAELTLSRFEILGPGAVVTATGKDGPVAIRPDVALYRGSVAGDPGSWAVLGVSESEVLGQVHTGGSTFALGPVRAPAAGRDGLLHLVTDARDIPARPGFECQAEEPPGRTRSLLDARPGRLEAQGVAGSRLLCRVAVDCDYEFYTDNSSNLSKATLYVLTLMAVASVIYERDINVNLEVSYLNVWTTTSPYPYVSFPDLLPAFRDWWNANRTGVTRDIAHLVSGRGLGGGIAYLDVLCDGYSAYGLSPLNSSYTYPTNSTTNDALLLTHEIGHNFGSPHTHSCFWQANGYVSPGALIDTCAAGEGTCNSAPIDNTPTVKSTIMSYCNTNYILMSFHPACIAVMRDGAEACLGPTALQPPGGFAAVGSDWTVNLSWTASPSPGVIRYDVFASKYDADPNPPFLASSTGTTYTNEDAFGSSVYRVRGVTASDSTPFAGPVSATGCVPPAPQVFTAGNTPRASVVGDFNEDGILDVALTNFVSSGTVSIFVGQGSGGVGNGTFMPRVAYTCNSFPAAIAAADLDQDGITDLVVANRVTSGTCSILRGAGTSGVGDGTFLTPPATRSTGKSPESVLVRDLDEDGIMDLVVSCGGDSTVTVHRGLGTNGVDTGTFGTGVSYPVGRQPTTLVAGDFNEDGILDLAVSCRLGNTVDVLIGRGAAPIGDGTFEAAVHYGANASQGLVAADFNEDGIMDLATSALVGSTNRVTTFLGQGTAGKGDGTFASGVNHSATGGLLAAADVNGNGITDLLATGSSVLYLLLGKGPGSAGDISFAGPHAVSSSVTPQSLCLGDFNVDGVLDWVCAGPSSLSIILPQCSPTASASLALTTPNGGEAWPVSSERAISWTQGPAIPAVTIEISRDNGSAWEEVATGVVGNSFVWTVTPPVTGGATARVRIRDATNPYRSDLSESPFQIVDPPTVSVADHSQTRLELRGIVPNPSRGPLVVSLALPATGRATLEIVDIAGRRLLRRDVGSLGPGAHQLELVPRGVLPSGVYWVALSREGERISQRFAIVR